MGNNSARNIELPKGTTLKVIGESGKHWRALAAWLTESQAETGRKRLGSEGILNQRKTQG